MKIVVLGAGGRVGQNMLLQSIDDGHEVTGFVRSADSVLLRNPRLHLCVGDALSRADITRALAGADAVISALGSRVLDKPITLMSEAMSHILAGMQVQGVKRVLAVAGSGILQADAQHLRMDLPDFPPMLRHVSEDHLRVYDLLRNSAADWTLVCPPMMPSDARTEQYRVQADYLPEGATHISAADCAHFVVREALQNAFAGRRVGIGY
ncbi:MAG: SDR family oxidoreductase [Bacteroidetes bacterium]|nr:SDR family oxidoreductase [Bacteroidota bacterium]